MQRYFLAGHVGRQDFGGHFAKLSRAVGRCRRLGRHVVRRRCVAFVLRSRSGRLEFPSASMGFFAAGAARGAEDGLSPRGGVRFARPSADSCAAGRWPGPCGRHVLFDEVPPQLAVPGVASPGTDHVRNRRAPHRHNGPGRGRDGGARRSLGPVVRKARGGRRLQGEPLPGRRSSPLGFSVSARDGVAGPFSARPPRF